MNKIIGYITIFIIFYLQISILNPNVVKAQETLIIPPSSDIIIPESNGTFSGTSNTPETNTGTLIHTGTIIDVPQNIPPTPIETPQNNIPSTPVEIETYFVVTAYYSPLPNQEHYLKGNYQDEITLNGKGLRGASGKEVFAGMLAGPKSYNFGTKIYLEGLGIGEISDRGGAIVSSTGSDSRGYAYDRIDVWMGSGEEGLKRALAWGKRTIKGKILLDASTGVNINLASLPAPDSVVRHLVNKPYVDKSKELAIFSKNITPESGTGDIKELQSVFSDMGLYHSGAIDGKYTSIVSSLINYQIKIGIIKKASDDGAGYFGPKTRTKLREEYIAILQNRKSLEEQKILAQGQVEKIKSKVKSTIDKFITGIQTPKVGESGTHVRNLQKSLKTLGYLKVKDTATYGIKTKSSLIAFQIDKGIIQHQNELGAGVFGPKTKEVMKKELSGVIENYYLKKLNLVSYVAQK